MRSIVPAILLSIILLVLLGPVVSATGMSTVETIQPVVESQLTSLPTWGYALLGVNLLVAGGLAAFPFLAK